jgi:hypothetical protein
VVKRYEGSIRRRPQNIKGASAAKPMRPVKLSVKLITRLGAIYAKVVLLVRVVNSNSHLPMQILCRTVQNGGPTVSPSPSLL